MLIAALLRFQGPKRAQLGQDVIETNEREQQHYLTRKENGVWDVIPTITAFDAHGRFPAYGFGLSHPPLPPSQEPEFQRRDAADISPRTTVMSLATAGCESLFQA